MILFTLPSLLRPDMSQDDVDKLFFPHFTYNLQKYLLLYRRYNDTIRALGRTNGVPVIELQEPLKGRESQLFYDTAHLECEGTRLLGEHLHGVLSEFIEQKRDGTNLSRR